MPVVYPTVAFTHSVQSFGQKILEKVIVTVCKQSLAKHNMLRTHTGLKSHAAITSLSLYYSERDIVS